MTNLHKSIGPRRDRTRDPWICSQTRIYCQTRYRLHCTRPGRRSCSFYIDLCVSMKVIGFKSARWIIFSCIFCRLLTFYRVALSKKNLSGILSDCQTVWIQTGSKGMIRVQTVCREKQQTTKSYVHYGAF